MEKSEKEKSVATEQRVIMLEKIFFEKYVRKMRTSSDPDHDYNHFPFQCRTVVDNILIYAEEYPQEVKIFLGDINREFYQTLLFDRIKELSKKGCTFDIVLAKPQTGERLSSWQELNALEGVRVRVKPKYNNQLCHLILVGSAYRVEVPHPPLQEKVTDLIPERNARFGFHEKDYTSRLQVYWNQNILTDIVELPAA